MRIHYLSIHQVLEYDEVRLFTDLGFDVFSHGVYRNPSGHSTLHRPGISGMTHYPDLERIAGENSRTNFPQELIDPFDVFIVMGGLGDKEILIENWTKIKHKKVIWRTIGQSSPDRERSLKHLRDDGLKIVRFSPKEKNMPDYIGQDEVIRFYKDATDYCGWNGQEKRVITIIQSLLSRDKHCYASIVQRVMSGFKSKVFGVGNEDLGNLNGGQLTFDALKGQLRDNRVYFYAGTWPASYTLSFIEAFMTGIPIVTISKRLWQDSFASYGDLFEVTEFIEHGKTGFIADSIDEARNYIKQLLDDDALARRISDQARIKAIELFNKKTIQSQWQVFLKKL